MRRALAFVAAALLAGCGETPAGQALRQAFVAPPEPVLALPAEGPALLLTAPRQAVLLPVPSGGPRRIWRASAEGGGIAIGTDGARVTATAGFAQMMTANRVEGADPLAEPAALAGREVPLRRVVDLSGADRDPAGMRFGVMLDCTLRAARQDGVLAVEERCAGAGIGFVDRWWFDTTGRRLLRSEQWAGEGVPVLAFEPRGM